VILELSSHEWHFGISRVGWTVVRIPFVIFKHGVDGRKVLGNVCACTSTAATAEARKKKIVVVSLARVLFESSKSRALFLPPKSNQVMSSFTKSIRWSSRIVLPILALLSVLSSISCRCTNDETGCVLECQSMVQYYTTLNLPTMESSNSNSEDAEEEEEEEEHVEYVRDDSDDDEEVEDEEEEVEYVRDDNDDDELHDDENDKEQSNSESTVELESILSNVVQQQAEEAASPPPKDAIKKDVSRTTVPKASPKKSTSNRTATNMTTTTTTTTTPTKPPLLPMQVMNEYIAQHNAHAVRLHPENRTYFRVEFGCPRQAGVQAANFMNAFLLAVASNRTLLFEYRGLRKWIRNGENTQAICEKAFDIADWMPVLNRVFPGHGAVRDGATKPVPGVPPAKYVGNATILSYTKSWGFADYRGEWHGVMNLLNPKASAHFTESMGLSVPLKDDKRIQDLYSEGPLFLYGMLFMRGFSFTKEVMDSIQKDLPPQADDPNVFSIGLHSRHSVTADNGSDVRSEISCIKRVLASPEAQNKTCLLYIMSDREATITNLTNSTQHSCTVAAVTRPKVHTTAAATGPAEHGPFAGLGYFQDAALVMHAQSAMLGRSRSSTNFVVTMMEYRRKMQAWRDGQKSPPPMLRCRID